MGRDHVVGQPVPEVLAQFAAQCVLLLRVGRCFADHQIPRQLLATRPVDVQHYRLAHARVLEQACLDLAQFDAQAADFHLVVETALVLDHPVRPITRQVTGAVQATAALGRAVERVRDEAFRRQRRAPVITAGQADAAQVQLTGSSWGDTLQTGAEDVRLQVVDRAADRHAAVAAWAAGPVGDVDGRFGRAVEVVQLGAGQPCQGLLRQLCGQGFAAAHHALEAAAALDLGAAHERLQHRRHEVQRGHRVLPDHLDQALRITVFARLCHRQASADKQWPEELPDRDVETERGLLQHGIAGVQAIGLLHPAQAVDQRPMAVARALGAAGGAGGVDHVGQVVRAGVVNQVGLTVARQRPKQQRLHTLGHRQLRQQVGLRQQQADAAVLHHVGQALGGVFRVQRHIGATGLENAQQADDHVHAALGGNAHQHVRPHALLAQLVRQLVGAPVQLAIAQGLIGKYQRRGIRGGGDLGFDQLLQALLDRVIGLGAVPVVKHLLLLGGIQQWQLGDALLRLGDDGGQQALPVPGELGDGGFVEQRGGVGQERADAVLMLERVQGQVELGGMDFPVERLQGQAWQMPCLATPLAGVVVHHLEQRAMTEAALWLQGFDQLLERQVLMRLCAEPGLVHLLDQRIEGGGQVEFGLEHLGVDEEADEALDFAAIAVGDRDADADIVLPAVAVQQGLEACQQQREEGHALALGQQLQRIRQRIGEGDVEARACRALHRATRAVQRQFEHRLFVPQPRRPVAQLLFALARFHPLPLPQRVVGILHRERRQSQCLPGSGSFVETHQLVDHDRCRPAIGDDVVQGQDQHMVIRRQAQQLDPQQRALLQVEWLLNFLLHPSLECRSGIGTDALERFDHQREGCLGVNHLHRLVTVEVNGSAQGFVSSDQAVEAGLQRLEVEIALQAQGDRNVVSAALGVHLPEKPLPLLGVGQCQDLLRRPRRDRRDSVQVDSLTLQEHGQSVTLFGGQRFDGVEQRLH